VGRARAARADRPGRVLRGRGERLVRGRWGQWAARLGVAGGPGRVLADGAEWNWDEARRHLPGAAEGLDVYYALELVAAAGRAVHGEGEAFAGWLEGARRGLIGDGWHGACEA